ncbi:site-specific integrase [Noviherbaspirillum malthae]|uniref:site-specific integrase n=1 Tax=Noviherbaspirillum malthae TaxID=1260987 RepID=UPI0018903A95|nr:site-specific integrase [Noviherbaspirillum malthae]
MSKIDQYVNAATRDNTRKAYQGAVRHFEVEWGGFLPATAESIARYLADQAHTFSVNTLRQRLAALAQWHVDQGFPDSTKAPIVKKVFKGIQVLHPAQEKRAKPLQLKQLAQVDRWLEEAILKARTLSDQAAERRPLRNRALLLLGLWRGFRGDELTRLRAEHVEVVPGQGTTCYLSHTKTDRQLKGTTFKAPALARLCPVEAYLAWVDAVHISEGAIFRKIDRWGYVSDEGLHIDSLVPLLRSILKEAGVDSPELYSGHSLRRGFATWASANGWDVKTLMDYVGWKDVHSAMRYVETADPFARHRINDMLALESADAKR